MKKIILLSILAILGWYVFFNHAPNRQGFVQGINELTQSPQSTTQTNTAITPASLSIPKLGVNADVESVGMNARGEMDTPKNVNNVAWYSLGYKPGDKGSAVFAGHLDTASGAPSVFYNISQLKTGDTITVSDSSGKQYTYKVTETRQYPYNKFPLQEVFGSADKARLNLITCGGAWDENSQNYSQRTVVYSELVE